MMGIGSAIAAQRAQERQMKAARELARAHYMHEALSGRLHSIPDAISVAISRDSGITVTCKTRIPKVSRK